MRGRNSRGILLRSSSPSNARRSSVLSTGLLARCRDEATKFNMTTSSILVMIRGVSSFPLSCVYRLVNLSPGLCLTPTCWGAVFLNSHHTPSRFETRCCPEIIFAPHTTPRDLHVQQEIYIRQDIYIYSKKSSSIGSQLTNGEGWVFNHSELVRSRDLFSVSVTRICSTLGAPTVDVPPFPSVLVGQGHSYTWYGITTELCEGRTMAGTFGGLSIGSSRSKVNPTPKQEMERRPVTRSEESR